MDRFAGRERTQGRNRGWRRWEYVGQSFRRLKDALVTAAEETSFIFQAA